MDEIILLRYVERGLAVSIGGMSIYLGYRLFLCVPEQKEGEANIKFTGGASVFITEST